MADACYIRSAFGFEPLPRFWKLFQRFEKHCRVNDAVGWKQLDMQVSFCANCMCCWGLSIHDINPEVGHCIVCRTAGETSTDDKYETHKPVLYTMLRYLTVW